MEAQFVPPFTSGLYLENHFVCDCFQVAHELRLTPATCLYQGFNQPL
jgi:hypothetical protein